MGRRGGRRHMDTAERGQAVDRFADLHPGRRLQFLYTLEGNDAVMEASPRHGRQDCPPSRLANSPSAAGSRSEERAAGRCATDVSFSETASLEAEGEGDCAEVRYAPAALIPPQTVTLQVTVLDAPSNWFAPKSAAPPPPLEQQRRRQQQQQQQQEQVLYASMVVPQGMEGDWVYSGEGGQWQLVSSARVRRLLLVARHCVAAAAAADVSGSAEGGSADDVGGGNLWQHGANERVHGTVGEVCKPRPMKRRQGGVVGMVGSGTVDEGGLKGQQPGSFADQLHRTGVVGNDSIRLQSPCAPAALEERAAPGSDVAVVHNQLQQRKQPVAQRVGRNSYLLGRHSMDHPMPSGACMASKTQDMNMCGGTGTELGDKALKRQLRPLVLSLAPLLCLVGEQRSQSIPFLSFRDDVVWREVVEVAHSAVTGGILVEDVAVDLGFGLRSGHDGGCGLRVPPPPPLLSCEPDRGSPPSEASSADLRPLGDCDSSGRGQCRCRTRDGECSGGAHPCLATQPCEPGGPRQAVDWRIPCQRPCKSPSHGTCSRCFSKAGHGASEWSAAGCLMACDGRRIALRRRMRFERMPNLIQSEVPLCIVGEACGEVACSTCRRAPRAALVECGDNLSSASASQQEPQLERQVGEKEQRQQQQLLQQQRQRQQHQQQEQQQQRQMPLAAVPCLQRREVDYSQLVHKYLPPIVAGLPLISSALLSGQTHRIVVVGGGAFTLPMFLLRHFHHHIHVVELDPVVIALACRHFGLDDCSSCFASSSGVGSSNGDSEHSSRDMLGCISGCSKQLHVHVGEGVRFVCRLAKLSRRHNNGSMVTAASHDRNTAVATAKQSAQRQTASIGDREPKRQRVAKGSKSLLVIGDVASKGGTIQPASTTAGSAQPGSTSAETTEATPIRDPRAHLVVLDVDESDGKAALSSPPPAFLSRRFLRNVRDTLHPDGMLAVNVVPCSDAAFDETVELLASWFAEVYGCCVDGDVNRVLFCLPSRAAVAGAEHVADALQSLVPMELMQKVELLRG